MYEISPDSLSSERNLDWAAVAKVLGEWADKPIALLDGGGTIRLFNRAMEQILGWTRFDVVGHPWSILQGAGGQLRERRWMDEALKGALHRQEVEAQTKASVRVILDLEVRAIGQVSNRSLLVRVLRVTLASVANDPSQWREIDYEVSTGGSAFGRLLRVQADGALVPVTHSEARCYNVLHQRTEPCPDCPFLHAGELKQDVLVRHSNRAREQYEVVTSQRVDDSTARLRVRTLSGNVLAAIHETKLQRLCDRARLSSREREVLSKLLEGRSVEEIADAMGIRSRTVKYHQANVLQKVGADSRTDLLRLLQ